MKDIRNAVLCPVLAMGLAGNGLAAQPRGGPQHFEETPLQTEEVRLAVQTADMEAWLRRLVGRFRIENPQFDGFFGRNRPDNMVDCVGIGAGAGVHCIFYSAEPRADGSRQKADEELRRGDVLRVSKVVEYGFDPNAGRIRMMVADQRSVKRVDAVLDGDTVKSRTRCWDTEAVPPCEVIQWIEAPRDGEDIWVSEQPVFVALVLRYIWRRMSAEEAAEAEIFIESQRNDRPGQARPGANGARKSGSRPR